MILDQRVIHASTDISTTVNDYRTGEYTFAYTSGQYLYVGAVLPFNNLWFELGTVNDVSASVSVQMWYGNSWVNAVDVRDQTSGLFQSGRIAWNTDILKGWDVELRCSDVTGLSSFEIYNMYWLRFSWSASLKSTMTVKYVGQKFSNDSILASYYPDLSLSAIKTAFASGKTSWDEQHFMATERILRDLKTKNIIKARGQVLDYDVFAEASCHKVAEIVYSAMGKPYREMLTLARDYYKDAINIKYFDVDQNADGRLDPIERKFTTDFLLR